MNLVKRSIVALVGIPLLIFVASSKLGWLDMLFAAMVVAFSIFELLRMFKINEMFHLFAALAAGLAHLAAVRYSFSEIIPFVILTMVILGREVIAYNDEGLRKAERAFITCFGTFYIAYFFRSLSNSRIIPLSEANGYWRYLSLYG